MWSDEDRQFVRDNYGKRSASLIAFELGNGKSRNAVIGVAKRMGLCKEGGKTYKPSESRPRPTGIRWSRRKAQEPLADLNWYQPPPREPESKHLNIVEVGHGECRFMPGDSHLCCGHPTFKDTSWCEFHYGVVYTKPINQTRKAA